MARHRDISNVHAKLEGEVWHMKYHLNLIEMFLISYYNIF